MIVDAVGGADNIRPQMEDEQRTPSSLIERDKQMLLPPPTMPSPPRWTTGGTSPLGISDFSKSS
jgi:hypothetical protein